MRAALYVALSALAFATWGSAASVQEINDLFAKKDYAAVITQVDTALTGEVGALSDQQASDLMTLKADALLAQGSTSAAVRQFEAAAKAAPDMKQIAWDRASAAVVRRSMNGKFTARGTNDGISVMDAESRKKAMAALLDEVMPDVQRRQQAAMQDTTLPAMEQAVLPVANAYFLEVAATGQATQTGPMLKAVGEHARFTIEKDLQPIQQQVTRLSYAAASFEPYGAGVRGLSSPERDKLRDLLSYLERVEDRVSIYRKTAARFNGDSQAWDSLQLRVMALINDVQSMLTTVY